MDRYSDYPFISFLLFSGSCQQIFFLQLACISHWYTLAATLLLCTPLPHYRNIAAFDARSISNPGFFFLTVTIWQWIWEISGGEWRPVRKGGKYYTASPRCWHSYKSFAAFSCWFMRLCCRSKAVQTYIYKYNRNMRYKARRMQKVAVEVPKYSK